MSLASAQATACSTDSGTEDDRHTRSRGYGCLAARIAGYAALAAVFLGIMAVAAFNFRHEHFDIRTGSMSPAIPPGSEVYVQQRAAYHPGEVISFVADGHVVTHRYLGLNANGSIITRGDANSSIDYWLTPVYPKDIRGQVILAPQHLGYLLDPHQWTRTLQLMTYHAFWSYELRRPAFDLLLALMGGALTLIAIGLLINRKPSEPAPAAT